MSIGGAVSGYERANMGKQKHKKQRPSSKMERTQLQPDEIERERDPSEFPEA